MTTVQQSLHERANALMLHVRTWQMRWSAYFAAANVYAWQFHYPRILNTYSPDKTNLSDYVALHKLLLQAFKTLLTRISGSISAQKTALHADIKTAITTIDDTLLKQLGQAGYAAFLDHALANALSLKKIFADKTKSPSQAKLTSRAIAQHRAAFLQDFLGDDYTASMRLMENMMANKAWLAVLITKAPTTCAQAMQAQVLFEHKADALKKTLSELKQCPQDVSANLRAFILALQITEPDISAAKAMQALSERHIKKQAFIQAQEYKMLAHKSPDAWIVFCTQPIRYLPIYPVVAALVEKLRKSEYFNESAQAAQEAEKHGLPFQAKYFGTLCSVLMDIYLSTQLGEVPYNIFAVYSQSLSADFNHLHQHIVALGGDEQTTLKVLDVLKEIYNLSFYLLTHVMLSGLLPANTLLFLAGKYCSLKAVQQILNAGLDKLWPGQATSLAGHYLRSHLGLLLNHGLWQMPDRVAEWRSSVDPLAERHYCQPEASPGDKTLACKTAFNALGLTPDANASTIRHTWRTFMKAQQEGGQYANQDAAVRANQAYGCLDTLGLVRRGEDAKSALGCQFK